MKHIYKNEPGIEKNLDELYSHLGKLSQINDLSRKPDRQKSINIRQKRLQHIVKATVERLRFFRKEYHVLRRENEMLKQELVELKMILDDDTDTYTEESRKLA